jgi:hypothetical protein
MTLFDQRHQQVNHQIDVASDYFAGAQSREDAIQLLGMLPQMLNQTVEIGALDPFKAIDAEAEIKKAILEAKKEPPEQMPILDRLKGAHVLIEGGTAASSLLNALTKAADMVGKLF